MDLREQEYAVLAKHGNITKAAENYMFPSLLLVFF